jgi:hypothetical protein
MASSRADAAADPAFAASTPSTVSSRTRHHAYIAHTERLCVGRIKRVAK